MVPECETLLQLLGKYVLVSSIFRSKSPSTEEASGTPEPPILHGVEKVAWLGFR